MRHPKNHIAAALVAICLIPVVTQAQESTPQLSLSQQNAYSVTKGAGKSWQLSLIAGGLSHHLTTKYEPEHGYTEQHSNLGFELGQSGPGWVLSAQATWFNDSHDESSFLGVGAFGYRKSLPNQLFVYGGVGAGYVETSYYSGAIVLPFAEFGWWRISIQGSYLPELPDADSGLAAQFKFRIIEW